MKKRAFHSRKHVPSFRSFQKEKWHQDILGPEGISEIICFSFLFDKWGEVVTCVKAHSKCYAELSLKLLWLASPLFSFFPRASTPFSFMEWLKPRTSDLTCQGESPYPPCLYFPVYLWGLSVAAIRRMNVVGLGMVAYPMWFLLDFAEFILLSLKGILKVPVDTVSETYWNISFLPSPMHYTLSSPRAGISLSPLLQYFPSA